MSKAQLYQKMLNVMTAIDYLQKDDKVEFGTTKYKAISEEKVTTTVRAELIKNKLIVFPIEQSHSREGTLSTVDVKYKLVDTETGESEILVSSGTGADTQDKGVGKAMTYAFKYLFLRAFAIPTGEDPDKVSSAELDEKQKKASKSEDEAAFERESKLNSVLTLYQKGTGLKDKKQAEEAFGELLIKEGKSLETISTAQLIGYEKLFQARLDAKKKGEHA